MWPLVLIIPNLLSAEYVQKPGKLFVGSLLVGIKVTFIYIDYFTFKVSDAKLN